MIHIPDLRVKKLFPDANLPVRANPTDSGLDVFVYKFEKAYYITELTFVDSMYSYRLRPSERVLIHTGISVAIDPGFEIQVRPRSGNALKKGFLIVNAPGTLDSGYRGPVCVIIGNFGQVTQEITVGDKIAQLVVCPVILSKVVEVEDLDVTDRGQGGFGSTDAART